MWITSSPTRDQQRARRRPGPRGSARARRGRDSLAWLSVRSSRQEIGSTRSVIPSAGGRMRVWGLMPIAKLHATHGNLNTREEITKNRGASSAFGRRLRRRGRGAPAWCRSRTLRPAWRRCPSRVSDLADRRPARPAGADRALLYAPPRAHAFDGAGNAVPGWRQACFYGGFVGDRRGRSPGSARAARNCSTCT